jgi:membrane associated rhomboid family serine protease
MAAAVVRTTRDDRVLSEWCLVLNAADVRHTTQAAGGVYILSVDIAEASRVVAMLSSYDEERRRRPRASAPPLARSANAAWLIASAILIGHMALGDVASDSVSFTRGAARASAIRDGELWRIATALTLHADAVHAISNAVAGLLFLTPLCQLLGGGTAIALTAACGMAATLVNGWIRDAGYTGIGASTAVFAALGLLAGLRGLRHVPQPFWRRLRPIGAALAILAMLGASPQTDVAAHVLGLLAGVGAGLGFAAAREAPLPDSIDRALGITTVAVFAAAWVVAVNTS